MSSKSLALPCFWARSPVFRWDRGAWWLRVENSNSAFPAWLSVLPGPPATRYTWVKHWPNSRVWHIETTRLSRGNYVFEKRFLPFERRFLWDRFRAFYTALARRAFLCSTGWFVRPIRRCAPAVRWWFGGLGLNKRLIKSRTDNHVFWPRAKHVSLPKSEDCFSIWRLSSRTSGSKMEPFNFLVAVVEDSLVSPAGVSAFGSPSSVVVFCKNNFPSVVHNFWEIEGWTTQVVHNSWDIWVSC